jgi:TRAP-type transport system periplasmic protein
MGMEPETPTAKTIPLCAFAQVLQMLLCIGIALFMSSATAQVAPGRQIKFAMQSTPGSAQYDAAVRFAEAVRARSGGRLDVKLFGAGVLGNDVAVVSAMRGGTVEMAVLNTSLLAGVVKAVSVFDFPFVFKDEMEAYAVIDGPFGKKMHDLLEPVGLLGLSYWGAGVRHFHGGKRPINTLEDLKGLKIRVFETSVYVDFMKGVGANPIALPFSELYGALEQKAVDGGTQQINTMVNGKLYEVQKYVSLTGHMVNPQSVVFSKKLWDSYPVADRKLLRDAADETRIYARQLERERQIQGLEMLKTKGIQINELTAAEISKMKDKARPVIEKHTRLVGEALVNELFLVRDKARGER